MRLAHLVRTGLSLALLAGSALAQTTWYVDVQNPAPGSGTLADPYHSIQFAIDASSTLDGDTLSVVVGIYVENVDFAGKAITVHGQGSGIAGQIPDIRPLTGTGVLFVNGEGPGSVLRHMSVRGVDGTMVQGESMGAGVLIRGASPLLEDVAIGGGSCSRGGGVAIVEGSSPYFRDVIVRKNDASWGGGLWVSNSSLEYVGGILRSNHAFWGGGLAAEGAQVVLRDMTIRGPLGSSPGSIFGDGLHCTNSSSVYISDSVLKNLKAHEGAAGFGPINYTRCLFEVNYGHDVGGAIHGGTAVDCLFRDNISHGRGGAAAWAQLIDCRLENNEASHHNNPVGGGAYMSDLVDCEVIGGWSQAGGGIYGGSATRTRFIDNFANTFGGGAALANLDHCEFFGNESYSGDAVYLGDRLAGFPAAGPGQASHCTFSRNPGRKIRYYDEVHTVYLGPNAGPLTHCVFEHTIFDDIFAANGADVTYCCLSQPFPGTGNFVANPRLASRVGYDANLLVNSPCIDAGDPNSPPDPDGSIADLGARAFDPSYYPDPYLACANSVVTECSADAPTSMLGSLSASGVGSATLRVEGLGLPAAGYLFIGLNPGLTFSGLVGDLCIDAPQRIGGMVSTTNSATCSGVLDLDLPSIHVMGMAGTFVYLQGAIFVNNEVQATNAYELLIRP